MISSVVCMKMKKRRVIVVLSCLLLLVLGVGITRIYYQMQYRLTLADAKTWSCFKNDPENVYLHFHWCDDGIWTPHWQINSSHSQRYARKKVSVFGTGLER